MTIEPTLKSQRDQKYGEKLKLTNTTNFPSNVANLPLAEDSQNGLLELFL
jgi:hypothetical protein